MPNFKKDQRVYVLTEDNLSLLPSNTINEMIFVTYLYKSGEWQDALLGHKGNFKYDYCLLTLCDPPFRSGWFPTNTIFTSREEAEFVQTLQRVSEK